jgi:hypothetical protein
MNILDLILMPQTDKEYINECKKQFLKLTIEEQKYIENCSTDELEMIRKKTFDIDYKKAIKYELMLRLDFKEINF